jgi:hypothetical protein
MFRNHFSVFQSRFSIVPLCGLAAAILLCAASSIPAAWAAPVRLIVERNIPTGVPTDDQFLHSYPSLTDLLNDTNRDSQAIPLFVSPDFSIAGVTVDSGGYRLLVERNIPTGVPEDDQFMHSYPSLTDLLNDTNRDSQAIPLFVSPDFSIAGFMADNGVYRMIVERNIPTGVPTDDQFMHSYPSLTDLLNDTNRDSQAIPLFVSPDFSIAGFAIDSESPTQVPEPHSLALLLVGLGCVALMIGRRGHDLGVAPPRKA